MRHKNLLFFLFFVLIFFGSCLSLIPTPITGTWFYTYTSEGLPTEAELTPANFICLQPNDNYTLDFGKFEYGKWKKISDTILLHSSTGNTKIFIIKYKNGKDLKLSVQPGVVFDFESQPYSFKTDAAKPFSLQDNRWRIPALHKESNAEIKARVVNHCQFLKDYFTWALNSNITTLDVRGTPSPIQIYGNGFQLKWYYNLPQEWKDYFYDSADCQHANMMLSNAITNNTIALSSSDNKYKMFIGGFEQLEQILKKQPAIDDKKTTTASH
jgi:hypothetical protein